MYLPKLKGKSFFMVAIVFVVAFLVLSNFAFTALSAPASNSSGMPDPSTTKYGLETTGVESGIPHQGSTSEDLAAFIGQLIGAVLVFVGVIFLILMIYGGITWMIARGNEQAVTKAKDVIVNSIIGLVIVFISYAATSFIVDQLSQRAGSQPAPGVPTQPLNP